MKELIGALLLLGAGTPASQRGSLEEASTFRTREAEGRVVFEAAGPAATSLPVIDPSQPSETTIMDSGEWELACELKSGKMLVFDRRSVRDLSGARLFRWAVAEDGGQAESDPQNGPFTGVAHCREKALEAVWPGKMVGTKAGTAGRRLVDSVCARTLAPAPVRGQRSPPRHR